MVASDILEAAEGGDIAALERFGGAVTQDIVDEFGCSALHYAARQGGADIFKFLVQKRGFKANARSNIGATPLHDAAAAGNLVAVQWLLEHTSCDINDQDGTGATILHLACRFHHTHVTGWLLDIAHPRVTMKTASGGLPLHFAVVGGDYEATKLLLEEDPMTANSQTENGATATYLAAQEGQEEILRLLIQDYRGNVKMKAYDGMGSLHAAAQSGHLACVKFLVEEEKCNPNERDFDGASPLHFSASQGHHKVIDWLMKVGGARVTLDNIGGSPLHNAAETNQLECIKVLIDNGCSTEITDNNGLTAAELARKCFNFNSATLIETYKPHPQRPLDPDLEYLAAVQSPRNPVLAPRTHSSYLPTSVKVNGYSLGNHDNRTVSRPLADRNPQRSYTEPEVDYPGARSVSPLFEAARHSLGTQDQWDGRDSGESESVIARVDSEECLAGVPRNLSVDYLDGFSADRPLPHSSSSSSLSSLSHLDEVVAVAVKEYERETLEKKRLESINQVTSNHVTSTRTSSNINQFHPGNQRVLGGYQHLAPPKDSKSVRFLSEDKPDTAWTHRQRKMEADNNTLYNGTTESGENGHHSAEATNADRELTNGNGNLSDSDTSESGEPAKRPVSAFTAEMMQSRRNTLTPAPAKTNSSARNSGGMDFDFVAELKKATKDTSMLKSTKVSDTPKPVMVFSAGQKVTNGTTSDKPEEKKESKVELVGEWDPKNFVDQVPNRASLPGWKVQLQARQIAEKAMKENLEKRQVEEREARFKNMPAWKRALVEKKENEAKAAEEKRQQEQMQAQQKKVTRKHPNVSVTPKSAETSGKHLAPWQMELQKK